MNIHYFFLPTTRKEVCKRFDVVTFFRVHQHLFDQSNVTPCGFPRYRWLEDNFSMPKDNLMGSSSKIILTPVSTAAKA